MDEARFRFWIMVGKVVFSSFLLGALVGVVLVGSFSVGWNMVFSGLSILLVIDIVVHLKKANRWYLRIGWTNLKYLLKSISKGMEVEAKVYGKKDEVTKKGEKNDRSHRY
jgi:hypothetical protein